MGAVENGEAELCGNLIILTNYNTNKTLILRSTAMVGFYFIIPRPQTRKELLISMVSSVDLTSRMLFVGSLVVFPIILCFILKVESEIYEIRSETSIWKSFLLTMAIMLNNSIRMYNAESSRMFYMFVMLLALIVTSLFQSTIVKNLNANVVLGEIRTLNEILDNDYNVTLPDDVGNFLKHMSGNRMIKKINEAKKDETIDLANPKTMPVDKNKKFALLLPSILLNNYLNQFYDNQTKENIFDVVPEMVVQLYTSIMLPKHSPLQDKINDIMQIIVESGILKYQLFKADNEYQWFMTRRILDGNIAKPRDKVISVSELKSVFYLYIAFSIFSIVVFCLELICFKIIKKLNPRRSLRI